MNVSLPADLENFVREQLASGAYRDEAELAECAIRRMQLEAAYVEELMQANGGELRRLLDEGLRELNSGQEIPIEQAFDEIESELRGRIEAERNPS